MEHTRFLLLTHKKHFCVEVVSSRIETVRRRIAECTSRNTPCVLLSFPSSFQICHVLEWHQNRCTWTMPTLSLPSFPTHVLPVLSVRNHLLISCVPPKHHNFPSRGNIIACRLGLKYLCLVHDEFHAVVLIRHSASLLAELSLSVWVRLLLLMCFSGTEIIGMKSGINYAQTTFNLELIMPRHYLINN